MSTDIKPSPIPRKLNPGMITALSECISRGNYPYSACQLCGIDWHTLDTWLSIAQEERTAGIAEEDSLYLQLETALKKAESVNEDELIKVVREAATVKREWLPAITMLERRHPDRWGRKDRTRIDITERKAIRVTHVEITLTDSQVIDSTAIELPQIGTGNST